MKCRIGGGLLVLTMLFGVMTVNAVKREPQLSREKLSNKKGYSYVPIPFPKTNQEIIMDLEYALKRMCSRRKYFKYKTHLNSAEVEILNFTKGNRSLSIGLIIRNINRSRYRGDVFYIVDIMDDDERIVARVVIEENGICASIDYGFPGSSIPPIPAKGDISRLLWCREHPKYKDAEIKKVVYECFAGGLSQPAIRVETDKGVFYLLMIYHYGYYSMFEVEEIKKFNNMEDFREFVKEEKLIKKNLKPFLLDELTMELHIMKGI